MRKLPPGFEFHKGLDGLVIGLTIVFLVRLEMVISSFINWSIIPAWSYQPIVSFKTGIASGVNSSLTPVLNHIQFNGEFGGFSVLRVIPESLSFLLEGAISLIGVPVLLTGTQSTFFLRQVLVIIGFWIAVGVPLWWWGIQPGLFWWRERSDS